MDDEEPPDGGGGDNPSPMEDESSLTSSQTNLKHPVKRPAEPSSDQEIKKNKPPSDSIQSIYTIEGYESNENFKYSKDDKGPFSVHVSRVEPDPSAGYSIRLLKFAQLIHKNNIQGITQGGIQALGRNKISIEFKTAMEANDFVQCPLLIQNKFTAIIPRYQISRLGVVKNIPTDWTLEELVLGTKVPSRCGGVVKARRLNVKSRRDDGSVSWNPSTTVVLTFLGQVLPEKVYCYNSSLPVSVYQLPTIQCRSCCRFGHVQAQCRSKPRCYNCAQQHTGDSCDIPDERISCFLCRGGNHKAIDRNCPEHNRQKAIKIIMSEHNLSYTEASLRVPSSKIPYSEVVSQPYSQLQSPPYNTTSSSRMSPDLFPSFSQPKTSYTKTVFRAPRSPPTLGKSYDTVAHNSITRSPSSSQPNGCALNRDPTPTVSPNDNLIELLVCSLINIISKFNDALPNNVSILLQQLLNTIISKNGSQGSPVEL